MYRLQTLAARMKKLFMSDSLFRNASYLMASTAIMSVLGFGFWLFVAHLYTASAIGIASALIAITLLISNLSMLGLNAGLIRFLQKSKNQSSDINAAIITVGAAAMVAALVYLIIMRAVGGTYDIFTAHLWSWPIFMVLMAAVALNTLTDAVFIANRRAEYHTLVYTSFGITKLLLPLLLIPFASIGIFVAYIGAVIVSLSLSIYFMRKNCGYTIESRPNWKILAETRKYAASNYFGVLLAGIPSQILPSIIIASLGSAEAAYFSMSWTMANLLYVIPSSITQSLLAESSHDQLKRRINLIRALRILVITLVPTILLAILIAPLILRIFGPQYAAGSTQIFQIMALSTIFISINAVSATILNIGHRSFGIVIAQATLVLVTLVSTRFLLSYGLVGVGIAMLLGYMSANIVYGIIFIHRYLTRNKMVNLPTSSSTLPALQLEPFLAMYGVKKFQAEYLTYRSQNLTILIRTSTEKFVLRIYGFSSVPAEKVENELEFMNHLAQNGIPITPIINNLGGEAISKIIGGDREITFILMKYVEGGHPSSLNEELVKEMARFQATIHVAGLSFTGVKLQSADDRLLNFRQQLIRRMSLLEFTPKGVSHFDYQQANILTVDNRIICVLDFEGMRSDSLLICLLFTLIKVHSNNSRPQLIADYLKSYQSIRPLGILERVLLRYVLILRFRSLRYLTLRY